MATTTEIKQRATTLSQKRAPNSITPEEVGGLFYDLAEVIDEDDTSGGVGKATDEGGEIFNDYGDNKATAPYAHAEGSSTTASGNHSHAEGNDTVSGGENAHAEGSATEAPGYSAHAEGYRTDASGRQSHAEGYYVKAGGDNSHAEGVYTRTSNSGEHAEGRYNRTNTGTLHSIGMGTGDSERKNAVEVMDDGRMFVNGAGGYNGTNPNAGNTKTVQEILSGIPTETQTLRDFVSMDDDTLGQLSVLKRIYPLLLSGTVGYCEYDSYNSEPLHVETTNNVKKIVYINQRKKIYAYDQNNELHTDWMNAEGADLYCYQNREFLADSNNNPIKGKMYLMLSEEGHMVLYFWDGSDMVLLLDFDEIKEEIGYVKVYYRLLTSGSIPSFDLRNDLIIYEYNDSTDDYGSLIYPLYNYVPKNGHTTKIILRNITDKPQVFSLKDSNDTNFICHIANGNDTFVLPSQGTAYIEVTYFENEETKNIYWRYTIPSGEIIVLKETNGRYTIPGYADFCYIKNKSTSGAYNLLEIEKKGPTYQYNGHTTILYIDNPPGNNGSFGFPNDWKVYGVDYGKSRFSVDSTYGEMITVIIKITSQEISATVIRNAKVSGLTINKLENGGNASSAYDINFYYEKTSQSVVMSFLNNMSKGEKTKIIINGDFPYYTMSLSNSFDSWTVLYPNGKIAYATNGVAMIDCICIDDKVMVFDVGNRDKSVVRVSNFVTPVVLQPNVKYVATDIQKSSFRIRGNEMFESYKENTDGADFEYYIRFRTGENQIFIGPYNTNPYWEGQNIPANTEVLFRVSNGFMKIETCDAVIESNEGNTETTSISEGT